MSGYELRRRYRQPRRRHNGYHDRRIGRELQVHADDRMPLQPTLEQIADPENLLRVFYELKSSAGTAPGPDLITYTDLGLSETAQVIRDLSSELLQRRYCPSTALRKPIPKASGRGYRTLTLRSIANRVVSSALTKALTPLWESKFLDRSYGFRPGRNVWKMLLAMEEEIIQGNRYVIAQDDVRNAFDDLNTDDALDDHRRHINDPDVLWLTETLLKGHQSENRTKGIDQGSAYSPTTLNVVLHHHHDVPFGNDATNPP